MEENNKKKRESFFNKIDHWVGAITAIPVFGVIIKMAFDKLTEKGAAKIQERVEKILGFNVEDAKKDVSDEIIYSIAVNALAEEEAKEIDAFEERLRRDDCCKAEAFVLFTAKIIKTFEREIKETTNTENTEKGKTGPRTEQVYKKLEEGLGHAKRFLLALLRNKGADAEATFTVRVAFLQGKNVFSLVKEKKESPIKGFVEKVVEKAKKTNETVSDNYSKGIDNLNSGLGDLLAKATAWRDRA